MFLEKYDLGDKENLNKSKFMHLTNYSINKKSKNFVKNKDNDETVFSSK